jgi:hypothetical protein
MVEKPLSCVLLTDRHHGLTEGVRGLLETAFGSVVMVADEASLLEGALTFGHPPDLATHSPRLRTPGWEPNLSRRTSRSAEVTTLQEPANF